MKNLRKVMVLVLCLVVAFQVIPVQTKSVYAASKVSISKTSARIWVKNYVNLKISGTSSKVTWKSSNAKIATVNSDGKVVGVVAGKATITATVDKKSYKCAVTVKKEKNSKPLEALVADIKKNKNSDKDCEILKTFYGGTLSYSSINGYQYADCNNDGIKELLINGGGDESIYICTVKNGKVVLAGYIRSTLMFSGKLYVNKKTNSLVLMESGNGGVIDGALLCQSAYINNTKLYTRTSNGLAKNVGFDDNAWSYMSGNIAEDKLESITKKDYDRLYNKYYSSKDMTEIKIEKIKR